MWVVGLIGWLGIIPLAIFAAKGSEIIGERVGLAPGYGSLLGAMAGLVAGFWGNCLLDERKERGGAERERHRGRAATQQG